MRNRTEEINVRVFKAEKNLIRRKARKCGMNMSEYLRTLGTDTVVTEAPIDLMSHASIAADFYGRDWMQDHRISTGCLWNGAIDRYLEGHPQIKRLVFAVDNDYLARDKNGQLRNWGQLTAAKWMKAYTEKGYACAVHVPHLNDFNTDLVEMRKGRSVEDLDRQRMAELETAFEQSAEEEPEQGMEV